jgi:hypothetical protein
MECHADCARAEASQEHVRVFLCCSRLTYALDLMLCLIAPTRLRSSHTALQTQQLVLLSCVCVTLSHTNTLTLLLLLLLLVGAALHHTSW